MNYYIYPSGVCRGTSGHKVWVWGLRGLGARGLGA